MKCIVYSRVDGGVSIVHPIEGSRLARSVDVLGDLVELDPPQPADTVLGVWPVPDAVVEWAETEDEFVARIVAKDVPADAIKVRVIDQSELPDRRFRDAWMDTGQIEVDMLKARDSYRNWMRIARAPLLEFLDREYTRADEGTLGNGAAGAAAKLAKKAIADQRQALRDVTADPAIDAATTPEELLATWPGILG